MIRTRTLLHVLRAVFGTSRRVRNSRCPTQASISEIWPDREVPTSMSAYWGAAGNPSHHYRHKIDVATEIRKLSNADVECIFAGRLSRPLELEQQVAGRSWASYCRRRRLNTAAIAGWNLARNSAASSKSRVGPPPTLLSCTSIRSRSPPRNAVLRFARLA